MCAFTKLFDRTRRLLRLRPAQALASSSAAREAGLNPGQVLGALAPARRSMVGSLHTLPMDTMAGLLVALAEVRVHEVGD